MDFLTSNVPSFIALLGAIIVAFITTRFQKKNIEQLKTNFEKERKDKYMFASLDQKLERHQIAFDMALDITGFALRWERGTNNHIIGIETEALNKLIDMQNWWRKNCIYLEESIRNEFIKAVNIAFNYWAALDEVYEHERGSEAYNKAKEEKTSQGQVMSGLPSNIQGISGSIIPSENIEKFIENDSGKNMQYTLDVQQTYKSNQLQISKMLSCDKIKY